MITAMHLILNSFLRSPYKTISMRYLIMTGLLFTMNKTVAQTNSIVQFNSYNAVGFVAGRSPIAFTAQTVNGVKFNNWFAGAGFGIDNYFIKTLPLFFDLKRDVYIRHFNLFLFADIGTHFPIKDKEVKTTYSVFTTKGDLYLDAGIGCKFKTGKRSHIFLSLGNTYKKITQTEESTDVGFPYKNETVNTMSRISFKMEFQF